MLSLATAKRTHWSELPWDLECLIIEYAGIGQRQKFRNGKKPESLKPGTQKSRIFKSGMENAGIFKIPNRKRRIFKRARIFKTQNGKARSLSNADQKKPESLKAGIFKTRKEKSIFKTRKEKNRNL